MKRIFRSGLDITFEQQGLMLRPDDNVVHFGEDIWGGLSFWYEHQDVSGGLRSRTFQLVFTAATLNDDAKHIGACNHNGFTYHLYEILER